MGTRDATSPTRSLFMYEGKRSVAVEAAMMHRLGTYKRARTRIWSWLSECGGRVVWVEHRWASASVEHRWGVGRGVGTRDATSPTRSLFMYEGKRSVAVEAAIIVDTNLLGSNFFTKNESNYFTKNVSKYSTKVGRLLYQNATNPT